MHTFFLPMVDRCIHVVSFLSKQTFLMRRVVLKFKWMQGLYTKKEKGIINIFTTKVTFTNNLPLLHSILVLQHPTTC